MMKSIQTKLFFVLSLTIFLTIIINVLLNSIFLERYYVYKNKKLFEGVYTQTTKIIQANNIDVYMLLEEVEKYTGISIVVSNDKNQILVSSSSNKRNTNKLPQKVIQIINNYSEPKYIVMDKENELLTKLMYINKFNDNYIVLTKSLKLIKESVGINNEFSLISAIIPLILGSFFVYLLSREITKPIIKISQVADYISKLDFEHKINITSKDEIGHLGEKINLISEKLNDSINELKDDIDKRKQFVRDITHEMKTPIAVIKGYAEGLKYGVAEDKDSIDEYIDTIINECDRMSTMTKELLHLSKIEYAEVTISKTKIDLTKLTNMVCKRLEPLALDENIKFNTNIKNNCYFNADEKMIEDALINLITNAIKYTTGNKTVTVTLDETDNLIKFVIFNTCNYIPEDELKKIWDLFYKTDKTRTRSLSGSGVGLSIVQKIISLHNGKAYAENYKDGILFIVLMPK